MPSSVYILDIPKARSSLIERIEFDEYNYLLSVLLRYKKVNEIYQDVTWADFDNLCSAESIGRYYLNYIKPNFKQVKKETMAERPKTKNEASDDYRWIDLSINVAKIKKEWLVDGEKGTYLNCKLRMMPNGKTDKFGNLGFIAQSVPTEIYKAAEKAEKGSGKKIEGVILGNGAELDWGKGAEGQPGVQTGTLRGTDGAADNDDLPF